MPDQQPSVALVTGASRGVGRGIAAALADSGTLVFASGRTIAQASLPSSVVRINCDHTNDDEVAQLFARIDAEWGRLDVLVNSVWGGYDRMVEEGRFTMFRRAKLMLSDLPPLAEKVDVDVDLTDEHGMPRCARLRPPAIRIRS